MQWQVAAGILFALALLLLPAACVWALNAYERWFAPKYPTYLLEHLQPLLQMRADQAPVTQPKLQPVPEKTADRTPVAQAK